MIDTHHLNQLENKLLTRHKELTQSVSGLSTPAQKFLAEGKLAASSLRNKSRHLLTSATLTGSLLLNAMTVPSISTTPLPIVRQQDMAARLVNALAPITPHYPAKLEGDQLTKIENTIKAETGLSAKGVLEGQELNHQVGYIGYEQHLKRFPGDSIELHDEEQNAGVAPGLGAWGYFTSSPETFTTLNYMQEKYYSVAQVQHLPNFKQNFRFYRDWYKHRKILIINPLNGKAVVTVMGDVGPALWTGKQFGASPEAMKAIGLHTGPRKGLVLFLFLDDPDDHVPLGPLADSIKLNP